MLGFRWMLLGIAISSGTITRRYATGGTLSARTLVFPRPSKRYPMRSLPPRS